MVLCSQSGTLEGHPHHWHWPWLVIRELRITQVCRCWGSGSQCSQAKKRHLGKLNMWGNDWVAKDINPYKQLKLLRENYISKRWKQLARINGPQTLQLWRNKVYMASRIANVLHCTIYLLVNGYWKENPSSTQFTRIFPMYFWHIKNYDFVMNLKLLKSFDYH